MQKIIDGYAKFRRDVFPREKPLFAELVSQQSPEVLIITCADSRIVPNYLLQANPGELFISRSAGNIVPPWGVTSEGTTASIEYAVSVLKVRAIVVLGHSDCGAMKAALAPDSVADLPAVAHWLAHTECARRVVQDTCQHVEGEEKLRAMTERNVVAQLDHLRTHPAVASALARGTLTLGGWVYEIGTAAIRAYNAANGTFEPLVQMKDAEVATDMPRHVRAASRTAA